MLKTMSAFEAYKKIVQAERRIEKLNKELEGHLRGMSEQELLEYEKTTRLWEQGQ